MVNPLSSLKNDYDCDGRRGEGIGDVFCYYCCVVLEPLEENCRFEWISGKADDCLVVEGDGGYAGDVVEVEMMIVREKTTLRNDDEDFPSSFCSADDTMWLSSLRSQAHPPVRLCSNLRRALTVVGEIGSGRRRRNVSTNLS